MSKQTRRDFLRFLGRSGAVIGGAALVGSSTTLSGCTPKTSKTIGKAPNAAFPLRAIAPSLEDRLILAEGLEYRVLLKNFDPISATDEFGVHSDYQAFFPFDPKDPTDGLLWVNHEYLNPMFVSGYLEDDYRQKTKAQAEQEMYSVGGSIVRFRKTNGQWNMVENDPHNRRISALTMIPFAWDEPIAGSREAMGTLGNCAGGYTPWGTVLTCEENYDMFYGETDYSNPAAPKHIPSLNYGWDLHFKNPPEHYGWVVEVNPKTGEARKLVALGRCAHECATVHTCKDGRVVIYSGDDANDEHLYKFISDKPNDATRGTLYVANLERGEWIVVDYNQQPALKKQFKNQTEVLIRLREAAKLLGATPLARPEDIEIDPIAGGVYIALTNNKPKGDHFGQILKIEEEHPDRLSNKFKHSTFLAGGEATGFACPDNLAFDHQGNLWFTCDVSGSSIGKGVYQNMGNNGLFVVPTYGTSKGQAIRVGSAPRDAEFAGPYFMPDRETFLVSIQHPGETTTDLANPTSRWPEGGNAMPKSAIIAITGEKMREILQGA